LPNQFPQRFRQAEPHWHSDHRLIQFLTLRLTPELMK
jgi:hypothetical protein